MADDAVTAAVAALVLALREVVPLAWRAAPKVIDKIAGKRGVDANARHVEAQAQHVEAQAQQTVAGTWQAIVSELRSELTETRTELAETCVRLTVVEEREEAVRLELLACHDGRARDRITHDTEIAALREDGAVTRDQVRELAARLGEMSRRRSREHSAIVAPLDPTVTPLEGATGPVTVPPDDSGHTA